MNKSDKIIKVLFLILAIAVMIANLQSKFIKDDVINVDFEGLSTSETDFPYLYYWHQTWGNPSAQYANDLLVDKSGNVYTLGVTRDPDDDIFLLKYNSEGVLQWEQRWGGPDYDWGFDLELNSQGNIIIVGYTRSSGSGEKDILILCYNEHGILQWEKTWGSSLSESSSSLVLDENDNMFLTGSIWDGNDHTLLLIKFDPLGNYQWHVTWGVSSHSEQGYDIIIDHLGNLCITGSYMRNTNSLIQILVIKFDNLGNYLWDSIYGLFPDQLRGYAIISDNDGYLYITGGQRIYDTNNYDTLLVKYNAGGEVQWSRLWNKSHWDIGFDLTFDLEDNIIITSVCELESKSYDIALLSYNKYGEFQGETIWGESERDYPSKLIIDGNGYLYILGETQNFGSGERSDLILLKFGPDSTPPNILLINPLNNTIHNSGKIITVNVLDPTLDRVLYNWDNTSNHVWNSPYQTELPTGNGVHNLCVYANDRLGYNTSIMFQFITDDDNDHTPPSILLISPLNNTIHPSGTPINLEISDRNLDTVIYKWDNDTNTMWGLPYSTSLPRGSEIHRLYVFANDTSNNTITTMFQFTTEEEYYHDVIVDPGGGILIIVIAIFIIASLAIISVAYMKSKHGIVRDYNDEKRVSAPLVQHYSPDVVVRKDEVNIYYCDRCGEKIDFPANFCHGCGNNILYRMKVRYCRDCGTKIVTNAKYCVQCGRSV